MGTNAPRLSMMMRLDDPAMAVGAIVRQISSTRPDEHQRTVQRWPSLAQHDVGVDLSERVGEVDVADPGANGRDRHLGRPFDGDDDGGVGAKQIARPVEVSWTA